MSAPAYLRKKKLLKVERIAICDVCKKQEEADVSGNDTVLPFKWIKVLVHVQTNHLQPFSGVNVLEMDVCSRTCEAQALHTYADRL